MEEMIKALIQTSAAQQETSRQVVEAPAAQQAIPAAEHATQQEMNC